MNGKHTLPADIERTSMAIITQELAAAGVVSFKIEGRMKSEYYLATVVNAYRRILDGG